MNYRGFFPSYVVDATHYYAVDIFGKEAVDVVWCTVSSCRVLFAEISDGFDESRVFIAQARMLFHYTLSIQH